MIKENAIDYPLTGKRNIAMLVAGSFIATVGRGVTLPFLPLFLHNQLGMSILNTGNVLTLAIVVGILLSIVSGKLANLFSHKLLLTLSLLIFSLSFLILGYFYSAVVFVICFTLITCCYALYSTIIKCFISDHFGDEEKTRVFSLNYTFINIGWMVGPLIGAWLVGNHVYFPFLLSAILGLLAIVVTAGLTMRTQPVAATAPSLHTSARDKRRLIILWVFTLAIFLASFVFERFASCISQILMVNHDAVTVGNIVSVLITTNAITVVLFQYITGNLMSKYSFAMGFLAGTICLVAGLFIFSAAGENRVVWIAGMFFFSFGEIIFAPLQYRVIDQIAPPAERAFYFSFQNMGSLGGAVNPAVTGVLLAFMPPADVPVVLILVSVFCFALFYVGIALSRRLAPATA